MTTFTKNLAGTVSIDDEEFRVGLLRYSTDADVQFHLNGYSSSGDVKNAVDGVNYKGGITNTAQAIDKARTDMFTRDQGDRDYARNFILLITGQDKSLSKNDAWRAAERAETDGIQLYVIGLNINDRVELDETSSHPLDTYQYLTRSEEDLQDVPAQIYGGLLGSKHMQFKSNTVVSNHFHSVKILLFSSARSRDFDGMLDTGLPVSMYTTKTPINTCCFNVRSST
jgi:hypothetical protein